jgi:peptidoglycan/LPS O-acetylase OafA/YrhL
VPAHLNAGVYLAGIIAGFVYLESKDKLIKIRSNWMGDAFIMGMFFSLWLTAVLSFPMVSTEVKSSIWTVIYGTFMKHYVGIAIAVSMLGVMANLGWICRDLLTQYVFGFLGRISFTYYLTHFFMIRILMDGLNHPLEFTGWGVMSMTSGVFFLGMLAAIVLAVCIEYPVRNLTNEVFFAPESDRNKKKLKK